MTKKKSDRRHKCRNCFRVRNERYMTAYPIYAADGDISGTDVMEAITVGLIKDRPAKKIEWECGNCNENDKRG